jgi:hypothetical protein
LNHFTVPVAISTVLRGVVAPLVDPTIMVGCCELLLQFRGTG